MNSDKPIRDWMFRMPEVIHAYNSRPISCGAMMPGDAFEIRDDDRLIMLLVFYMTNKRIHGIWHHEATNQIFFCGYECQKCHEVFLVPDSVKDNATLHQAMHHKCMEER